MSQDYLMVNNSTNIVENIVTWDGNPDTWQPPSDTTMLVQSTTPAMVWVGVKTEVMPPTDPITYEFVFTLQEQIGAGSIGFTWNGSVVTTNEPQPEPQPIPTNQPITNGIKTA